MLAIEFDETKRQVTLHMRRLDFADTAQVFAGIHISAPDTRQDYGEPRYITMGYMNARLVVLVWTYRPNDTAPTHRRIISLRKANEREQQRFHRACAR